jgi:hypothetical protein
VGCVSIYRQRARECAATLSSVLVLVLMLLLMLMPVVGLLEREEQERA